MQKPQEEYSIGVLDIYGFEIFQVRMTLPPAHGHSRVAQWPRPPASAHLGKHSFPLLAEKRL